MQFSRIAKQRLLTNGLGLWRFQGGEVTLLTLPIG